MNEPPRAPRSALLSHYTVVDFGTRPVGKLHFPGRSAIPSDSVGYVRSRARALASAAMRAGRESADTPLPWRDYPAEALTATQQVLEVPFHDDLLLLGCRNVLNEWGHQLRLEDTWWRRAGDSAIDERWPVAAFMQDGTHLMAAAEAGRTSADLLTGMPLVIDGKPSERPFLIANCSDVAHVFEVHPQGLLGPSAEAWRELSEAWEAAHAKGLPDEDLAAQLTAIAARYGVVPGRHYLHSILAETTDGRILALALTGSLEAIAVQLVRQHGVANAILLDNGGSVGWYYCPKGKSSAGLLVGGPNRRDRGTAFLSIETRGFLHPVMHNALVNGGSAD